ncbi:hypothetical protein M413DRAFT_318108 [Hebeloma cylindrosporum]|uniref:Uncharacterized protein n=1 Tax=Hebeloma cylindrosporum TaxID=76867 RepID=A0A0C3CR36_HEBCY|nr:hypothetical protein M413DRAFT_318108 [Hebeloma cylindrosporum h7]
MIALFIGAQVTAIFIPGVGCQISQSHSNILPAIFIYSMCFDFIVLLLNTYKLIGITSSGNLMGRARLTHMIFTDGLIFFILAFLSNLVTTVFLLLNLNPVMGIIFNVPGAVISTIVACRAVRRLSNFACNGGEIYVASSSNNRPTSRGDEKAMPSFNFKSMPRSEIHVQMETFTRTEDNQNNILPMVKEGSEKDVEMNVDSKGSL